MKIKEFSTMLKNIMEAKEAKGKILSTGNIDGQEDGFYVEVTSDIGDISVYALDQKLDILIDHIPTLIEVLKKAEEEYYKNTP